MKTNTPNAIEMIYDISRCIKYSEINFDWSEGLILLKLMHFCPLAFDP